MAASSKKVVIVGLLLAIAIIGSNATDICGMDINDLMKCKPFANGVKPQVQPNQDCCSIISSADLGCFCGYRTSPWLKIAKIDPDQAMALPVLCKLKDSTWHC